MHCPFCQADKDKLKVIDSRACDGDKSIRRRRECLQCNRRFTTYERIEENARLAIIKKDGRREPWDRDKILAGLVRASFKRPIGETDLSHIVDEVEESIFARFDREVPSGVVGELVIEKLRRLDQVAYVRFASVHKRFKTLEELLEEARTVIDAKRFEDDPEQGRLFVEETPAAPSAPSAPPAGSARRRAGRPVRNGHPPAATNGSNAPAPPDVVD